MQYVISHLFAPPKPPSVLHRSPQVMRVFKDTSKHPPLAAIIAGHPLAPSASRKCTCKNLLQVEMALQRKRGKVLPISVLKIAQCSQEGLKAGLRLLPGF